MEYGHAPNLPASWCMHLQKQRHPYTSKHAAGLAKNFTATPLRGLWVTCMTKTHLLQSTPHNKARVKSVKHGWDEQGIHRHAASRDTRCLELASRNLIVGHFRVAFAMRPFPNSTMQRHATLASKLPAVQQASETVALFSRMARPPINVPNHTGWFTLQPY